MVYLPTLTEKNQTKVGQYTISMDPMGMWNHQETIDEANWASRSNQKTKGWLYWLEKWVKHDVKDAF